MRACWAEENHEGGSGKPTEITRGGRIGFCVRKAARRALRGDGRREHGLGMQLQSTVTCPACGHQATESMPTDACQFFYDCNGCGERLKPLPGDCCVFCSYGSVPCPPKQAALQSRAQRR